MYVVNALGRAKHNVVSFNTPWQLSNRDGGVNDVRPTKPSLAKFRPIRTSGNSRLPGGAADVVDFFGIPRIISL